MLRVNPRIVISRCKKAQKTSRQATLSGPAWLASNDQGKFCNQTDQARRQEPKIFLFFSFFFFAGLAFRALAGAKRERQSRAEIFFDRLPEVRTPVSAVSDFVLEGRISALEGDSPTLVSRSDSS